MDDLLIQEQVEQSVEEPEAQPEERPTSRARKREFGKRVRLLREAKRWTQEELALASGLSRSYVSRLELGDIALPRNDKLSRLARALGTSNEDLLEAAGYMSPAASDSDVSLPELAPYLRRKFGVNEPRLVDMVEFMIEMARREAQALGRSLPPEGEAEASSDGNADSSTSGAER